VRVVVSVLILFEFLSVIILLSSRPHCVPYGFREAAEKNN